VNDKLVSSILFAALTSIRILALENTSYETNLHFQVCLSPFLLIASAQIPDSVVVKRISDEIFVSGQCYRNEEYLCKKIGARLTGSANAQKAVNGHAIL